MKNRLGLEEVPNNFGSAEENINHQIYSKKENVNDISFKVNRIENPREYASTKSLLYSRKIKIAIIFSVIIFIAIIITIILVSRKKPKNNTEIIQEQNNNTPYKSDQELPKPDNPIENEPEQEDKNNIDINPSFQQIKKEFEILTKTGDLKRISVIQKSKEETKMNDNILISDIIRKTNYDIYFISEQEADKSNKIFYSKMYSGVVSIRSECASESRDCQPQPLVDLTQELSNLRNLENVDLFKDIPIALCLFNITDNNIITTFICPESLPDFKRNEIILDLYFFRPPAAQRADKENDNITLTKTEDKETNMTHIHETNGGLCNIHNNWGSLCTTDMNTTIDQKGNLISYDEQAITIINYDEKNSFIKNKVTNLIDVSENINENDIKNYEKSLNSILPLIKPYMKEEVQFTQSDYEDLYNVINDKKKSPELQSYTPKKEKNTFRNLATSKIEYKKKAELFSNKITPIQVTLDLKINSGINSAKMGAYGNLIYDDQELEFSSIEEHSSIEDLIDKISSLSNAGNYLASLLYDKVYNKFEDIMNEISLQINTLNDLLKFYELYQVFNTTLVNYSYKQYPNNIILISNELKSQLSDIFYNIKTGNIKSNVETIENNINTFLDEINNKIRTMLNNLECLSNILINKNNTFTVITNYYLNNTSSSYVNIIQKMKNILDTYFLNEYNIIYPKITELMSLLDQNSNDTLKKELQSIEDLYNNLRDGIYSINSITQLDYETVLSNLNNAQKYPSDIINRIVDYIKEKINIKNNGYFISEEDIKSFNDSFASIISEAEKITYILDNVDIIDETFDQIMIKFKESYIYTIKFMEEIKSGNFTLEEDVLNNNLFSNETKGKMETDIKSLSDEIITIIKRENEVYTRKIKTYFDSFLEDNLDNLNNIIIDLSILFSEEVVQSISASFEMSLNLSLQKFTNITLNNIKLTEEYIE